MNKEKPQTQRGPVLYLLANAVFSSRLSKWGLPSQIPTSPLIAPCMTDGTAVESLTVVSFQAQECAGIS
jgi:hypothetical protein